MADNYEMNAVGFYKPELSVRLYDYFIYNKTVCNSTEKEDYYHIIYNLSGNFQIVCMGKIFDFKIGDIAFFRPFEKYELIGLNENVHSNIAIFSFHQSLFEETPGDENFLRAFNERQKGKNFILEKKDFDKFSIYRSIIVPIKNYIDCNLGLYHFKAAVAMLITNISLVFDKKYGYIPSKNSSEYKVKIYDYITRNFCNNISINEISKKYSVSKLYINNVTKEFYRMNFHDTVTSMRMWHATRLIKEGIKLNEIYRLCGYTDYSGFYKAFRKFFNQTPTQRIEYINEKRKMQNLLDESFIASKSEHE